MKVVLCGYVAVRHGSVLRIRQVDSARDLYQCVASNVVGTAQSALVNVTVLSRT